jgi:hypothetical protein
MVLTQGCPISGINLLAFVGLAAAPAHEHWMMLLLLIGAAGRQAAG